MGKKDVPEGVEGFAVGGRPGREHPNGWSNRRIEVDKHPEVKGVYGWGADGVEGTRKVK